LTNFHGPECRGRLDNGETVLLPCRSYWKSLIKCQDACPVHTDSRGYIRAIASGNDELAYLIARGPNPLASICGRVCGAPCETSCRRGELDRPVAIRALKRFVCEKYGPETQHGQALIEFLKEAARKHSDRPCEGRDELLPLLQSLLDEKITPVKDKSVGIIGSGPAGLAAAHDLALLGFSVTIYELEPVLAGMLAVGIPEYRLPRDLIRAEVEAILELGVEAVTNCEVGKDVEFSELRERHDAVIVAVGAKRSRSLDDIPGVDAEGVLGGIEFLRDVAVGKPISLGKRVVVIGGGSVAYDVGRTVLRQTSLDAARTALREIGVARVHLCSLESLDEMPAEDDEIIEGDEEGIVRMNSVGPAEILMDDAGRVKGIVLRKCTRVFDEKKRFSPLFDDSVQEMIECDNVLLAIGQAFDISFIDPEKDGLETIEKGLIAVDGATGKTSAPDVFVAGDLAHGPKLLIDAVASGKGVAREVYKSITNRTITYEEVELHLAIPDYCRESGYEAHTRQPVPAAPVAERICSQSTPVEWGYGEKSARLEAGRCLDCGVNTVFDSDKCILCGGCVDVCPELCLRIVSIDRLIGQDRETPPASTGSSSPNAEEDEFRSFMKTRLDGTIPDQASAILKDETICIRCGLCAERCPTGAITMERFLFKETPKCQTA